MNQIVVNEPNRWRLETPGADWPRSARPDAARKYFMVSADDLAACHRVLSAVETALGETTDGNGVRAPPSRAAD